MSINVKIKTSKKTLDYSKVLDKLIKHGCIIAENYLSDDLCQFYQPNISTRPIDLSKEDDGYEVRITTMASKEDYQLFVNTVYITQMMTYDSQVFTENDEYVSDIKRFFDLNWIKQQMENDVKILLTLILGEYEMSGALKKHEVGLCGPIRMFYLGENLFKRIGISVNTDWQTAHDRIISVFRHSQYSKDANIRETTTSMKVDVEKKGGEENMKTATMYVRNKYDMISRAEYFILFDDETKKLLMMPYEDFMMIAPKKWENFDNCQYFTTPLTLTEYQHLWKDAQKYNIME